MMQRVPRKVLLPYLALGYGVIALSMSGLFVRWSEAAGPVTSFYRMAAATLLLLPVILLHLRKQGTLRPIWLLFPMLGGMFSALDHGVWSTAVQNTRIANAMLLNNIAPLWVALFSALVWRERLILRFWLGLLVTLAGMAVVVGGDMLLSPELNRGNQLALLSSFFYAGYFLVTRRGRVSLDPLTYVWFANLFAALSLLGITQAMALPMGGFGPTTWLVFLVAALVAQVGGYFALAYALGHLPASVVSITMIAQPVLSALLAIPFTGENLGAAQWLGVLAVLAGIYLVNISRVETV
jgi:drug/metabolite transporter (DMT)-like permease